MADEKKTVILDFQVDSEDATVSIQKLTAANNQHYLFAEGSERLFEKMSDQEKALVRLSNVF
ncbi:hypothetical protein EBU94_09250 [bacterium]|nr:hypothetical protein [bacterium]